MFFYQLPLRALILNSRVGKTTKIDVERTYKVKYIRASEEDSSIIDLEGRKVTSKYLFSTLYHF